MKGGGRKKGHTSKKIRIKEEEAEKMLFS